MGTPLKLLWVDGFDLVGFTDVRLKYNPGPTWFFFGTMQPPIGSVPGPDHIGQTWDIGNTGLGGAMFVNMPVQTEPPDTWIVNLSVQFKTNGDTTDSDLTHTFYPRSYFFWMASSAATPGPSSTHTLKLLTIADPPTPGPGYGRVRLQLWAGGSTLNPDPQTDTSHVTLWTSPYLVDHSHRYWFQIKFQQATGLIELWIDGVMVYTTTNPAIFGGPVADYCALYHQHYVSFGNSGPSYDDWVVFGKADSAVTLPLPMRVYSALMGTDVSRVWTPSTPPNNVTMIYDHPVLDPPSEALPDFDATYVSSAGSIVAETYKTGQLIWDTSTAPVTPIVYLPVIPSFSKVYGVGLNATAKSMGPLAGFLRGFVNGFDVGSDELAGDGGVTVIPAFVGYLGDQWQSITNPVTGLPWLAPTIRAADWGVRQTAGDDVRMTAYYLEIVGLLGPAPPPPGGGPYIRSTGAFVLG